MREQTILFMNKHRLITKTTLWHSAIAGSLQNY
jgi:hypothetical protein